MAGKKKGGLTAPLQKRPDPPVFIRGPLIDHAMTMILDQTQCQSCARTISDTERWGVVADVRRPTKNAPAVLQAVRLCSSCWHHPAQAMKQLGRAWE